MRRQIRRLLASVLGTSLLAGPAAAHVGGLGGVVEGGGVPTWLTILTGGVVVGASFLATSLLTDHEAIGAINARRRPLGIGLGALVPAARAASVLALAAILVVGLIGPREPTANLAILAVWAGWWAGYTMSVYLVGNTWPAINPWRAIAGWLPRLDYAYPERLGAWPAVVGLLAMVWLEVVSPVAGDPRPLAALIVAYTAVTLAGAAAVGPDAWFRNVDPIAGVFRVYGRLAPIGRTDDGLALRTPTAALTDAPGTATRGETAFVVALLWVTTYDGLVATPAWASAIRPLVRLGVPARPVYLLVVLAGFGLFYAVYRLAAERTRATADTYVSGAFIERWFVPALLPIAAGYHLAHFLGYFLALSPALAAVALDPLSPPNPVVLVLPGWFEVVQLGTILLGHLLAVWVAHSIAFDLFPGILTPIRSQYPFVVVMIFYTMTSLWIVTQPFGAPPFV